MYIHVKVGGAELTACASTGLRLFPRALRSIMRMRVKLLRVRRYVIQRSITQHGKLRCLREGPV